MTAQQFDMILEQQIVSIRAVLQSKSSDYATGQDRLHNFKSAVPEFGNTASEVCWGYLTKHLVSVRDLTKGIRTGSIEMIDEKIGDAINYLILLKAILIEQIMSSAQPNPQTQGNSEGI